MKESKAGYKEPKVKKISIKDLKVFKLWVNGKHTAFKEFQNLDVRQKKMLT